MPQSDSNRRLPYGVSVLIGDASSTTCLVLIAATTLMACTLFGGGLYEVLVVDPFWPKQPGIIQPQNGGISRRRFWIPAHTVFEVLLIVVLIVAWGDADVRLSWWRWSATP